MSNYNVLIRNADFLLFERHSGSDGSRRIASF